MKKVLILILLMLPAFALEVEVAEKYPVRGQAVAVTVVDEGPVEGAEVVALYVPNSKVSKEVPLGKTDAEGRLSWTPERAGLVTLTATVGEQTAKAVASVRFDSFPPSGMGVMIFAGLLLFGGMVVGFSLVLGGSPS